jgi:hypothetical protein
MKNNIIEVGIEPKEQSLFHYKEKPEHFYDLLRRGIWPRYCEEDFTEFLKTPVIIAFPVVCFCDIPLKAAGEHRSTYGDFAVSISKRFAGSLDINPMWYLQQGTTITRHVVSQLKKNARFSLDAIGNEFRPLLPYLKPALGCQAARNTQEPSTEVKVFEEEMEWRYSPCQLANNWKVSDSSGFVKSDDVIHNLSEAFRLKLNTNQIEDVIVPNAEHFERVKREFPDLSDKVRTWDSLSAQK